MKLVPWRRIESWSCIACGDCCKEFRVPLKAYEAARLARLFGYTCIEFNIERYVLRKRLDGRCIFQVYSNGKWVCGIQSIKPLACKIWPFLVSHMPSHGSKEEAWYEYEGRKYYIYVNTFCRGIAYGKPTKTLSEKVLPEFIELSLGIREKQNLSTSMLVNYGQKGHTIPLVNVNYLLLRGGRPYVLIPLYYGGLCKFGGLTS
ncbi:MAG: YkgJ family cysteine cluster protein [Candidatus Nezhaarchaeales archaeon]